MRGSVQTCWLPVLGASSQPEPIEILFLLVLHGPTLKCTISDIVFVEIIIILKEKDTWTVLNQTKCAVTACGPLIHSFWCCVGLKVLGVCDQRKRCICIREHSWLWCLDGAGPEETLPEDERRSLQIFRSLSRSSQLLDPSSPGSGLSFRSVPPPTTTPALFPSLPRFCSSPIDGVSYLLFFTNDALRVIFLSGMFGPLFCSVL